MKKVILRGTAAGLIMGIALFIVGAIAARIIYGQQMVPEGKFEPEQINALYFLWTKLLIGIFFGIIFTLIYSKFHTLMNSPGIIKGLLFSIILWLIISLWAISHPLVYEDGIANKNQLFWHIYTLGGFLAYGISIGLIYKK
jgi:Mn2+/Fe2+ NRAMP family transporter